MGADGPQTAIEALAGGGARGFCVVLSLSLGDVIWHSNDFS